MMGYVTESDATRVEKMSSRTRVVTQFDSPTRPPTDVTVSHELTTPLIASKSQRGFRSGAGSRPVPLPKRRRDPRQRIIMATTETPVTGDEPFNVNDRDYSTSSFPIKAYALKSIGRFGSGPSNSGTRTVTVSGESIATRLSAPSTLDTTSLLGEASAMMRNHRPTRPDFDLARFIGELRDAPSLFSKANYVPKSSRDAGGAYLNIMFGVLPTASDLEAAVHSVLKGHDRATQFIRDSGKLVRRTSTRVLRDEHHIESQIISPHEIVAQMSTPINRGNAIFRFLGGTYNTSSSLKCDYTFAVRDELRVFNTFEYFVGDPDGFVSRMDSYRAMAQKTIGGGFTVSTLYELTRFSWLVDWFADIGGLLAYQQDVADFSLVSRRGGYVLDQSVSLIGHLSARPNGSAWAAATGTVFAQTTRQTRRKGSPYDMRPTWDLDKSQWAILAALGLTRGPNVGRK